MVWTKEQHREYDKQYYQTHKEKIKNRSKQYRQTNKEKCKQYDKERYQVNKEKIKKRTKTYSQTHKDKIKQYYQINKEKIKEQEREHHQTHPEECRTIERKHHAKRRGLSNYEFNDPFEGCHGHHIDKECIIYIPKSLHISIWHNVFTSEGMTEINDKVFEWLGFN